LSFNDVNQERCDLVQVAILHIVVPGADKDAVIWLNDEVVGDVVDDDCFC